ncbi:MAG: hypothetical protein NVS9B15_13690 [Acidobacteriaceae bacterium]
MPDHSTDELFPPISLAETEPSLLDIADHVLNTGVVIQGSVVISLAGVDLVYLGVSAVLTSVETALKHISATKAADD